MGVCNCSDHRARGTGHDDSAGGVPQRSPSPPEWDGLHKVDSKKFSAAYLAPDADFKSYTKVLIDPTEAAFRKNWQRNYNSSQSDLSQWILDDEARTMLAAAQSGF